MESMYTLPNDLIPGHVAPEARHIWTHLYRADKLQGGRNRIMLQANLFSFVIEGYKQVHHEGQKLGVNNDQFVLLASGNCLMSENLAGASHYESVLLFFDNQAFADFRKKYGNNHGPRNPHSAVVPEPAMTFQKDPFIRHFVASLKFLAESADSQPRRELLSLKFEELMVYISATYPEKMEAFRPLDGDPEDLRMRRMVEFNLENNISIEELSFLCNTSVSTFKRRFARLYGTSPNKWMLQKRMERAADLLQQANQKPSDVYHRVGYESHSSFTQSFKQVYGITPREYQQQKLNV